MGLIAQVTVSAEDLARYEAARRAEDARREYGRTVDEMRTFIKRARTVRLWVRRGRDDDAFIVDIPRSVFAKDTKYLKGTDVMPSDYDPEERRLSIGSWYAIHHMENNP